jgi:hypothetical protein
MADDNVDQLAAAIAMVQLGAGAPNSAVTTAGAAAVDARPLVDVADSDGESETGSVVRDKVRTLGYDDGPMVWVRGSPPCRRGKDMAQPRDKQGNREN